MAINGKVWWKSRTIWINIVTVLISLLTGLEGYLSTTEAVTLIGVINVGLRIITAEAVAKKWF